MSEALRVLVTGSAGRIAYSLLPMIGQGLAFGPNQRVDIVLFDIPEKEKVLKGIRLEILDCGYKCFNEILICVDEEKAFIDADVIIFLGAAPRREGMQRVDLLAQNKYVFEKQGKLMDKYSKKTVKAVVVGNPANTNALVLSRSAPSIPKENITCLMRLDHNRTLSMISAKLFVPYESISNIVVWGNHSTTQFPCVDFMKVQGLLNSFNSTFNKWVENEMIPDVRKRGFDVISLLGASSALSAAKAVCDHMKDWFVGIPEGTFVTMGVHTEDYYNLPSGLFFGLPVYCKGNFEYEVVKDLHLSSTATAILDASTQELVKERNLAFSP